MSYLTFKKGTYEDLNNLNLTSNMLYVVTSGDDKGIYLDYVDTDDNDTIKRAKFTSQTVYDNQYITNNLCAIDKIVDGNISFQNKTNIGCGYIQQAIGDISSISNIIRQDSNTLSSSIRYIDDSAVKIELLWENHDNITSNYQFAAQYINLERDLQNEYHTIIFKTMHSSSLRQQFELCGKSLGFSNYEIGSDGTYNREVFIGDEGVQFADAKNISDEIDNHYIIPMAIYGVTGRLPLGKIGEY